MFLQYMTISSYSIAIATIIYYYNIGISTGDEGITEEGGREGKSARE